MRLIEKILAHPDVVTPPNSSGEATAWCPWHPDKTGGNPSLGINAKKLTCKCWVCGQPERDPLRSLAAAWGIIKPRGQAPDLGEIVATYDYRDEAGRLLYQVVRYRPKTFRQRRPDPQHPGRWLWSLGKTRLVPYRLPELLQVQPGSQWVWGVEGEKDADRLASLGLVATTNAQGAGKWKPEYNGYFKGHKVAIIPDDDEPGRKHAVQVARSLAPVAADVRLVELEPPAKDVSDWLDAGHTVDQLQALLDQTRPWQELDSSPPPSANGAVPLVWEGNRWRPITQEIIRRLLTHGFFLRTSENRYYFFDQDTKRLCEIGTFDMNHLLWERYAVNSSEVLARYLTAALEFEAASWGKQAIIRQFAYYDPTSNVLWLDLHDGTVLRLDGRDIQARDNGADGVLFAPTPFARPWKFRGSAPPGLLASTLIEPLNFAGDDDNPQSPDDQRLLMLLWLLSVAFEAVQPTKPIALAVGPAGAGKSLLFRRLGHLLFGPEYNVDALRKDKEDDYWVAVTSRPFVTFDNVDNYIPWLNDALAMTATGVQVTKRKLHTTNQGVKYVPRCMVSLTARTPAFRREDVASRLLVFTLDRIKEHRSEYELLEEVRTRRDELMSDYARMLNQVLAAPPAGAVEPGIRLADFARVASRIGAGLQLQDETLVLLHKLRQAQITYATEQNELVLAIDAWLSQPATAMGMTNVGRKVSAKELLTELKAIAEGMGMPWRYRNPNALGIAIKNLAEELEAHFETSWGHGKRGNWYAFVPRQDTEEAEK